MSNREANPNKFPRCPDCGGEVRLLKAAGRTREVLRGEPVPVPDNFEIPTCVECGEESMNIEVSERLDALLVQVLAAVVKKHAETVCATHGVTQQELEDVLGVTRSYLSHLIGGRKPSASLLKLLRVVAEVPGAFENAARRPPKQKKHAEPQAYRHQEIFLVVRDFGHARYTTRDDNLVHRQAAPRTLVYSEHRTGNLFGQSSPPGVG